MDKIEDILTELAYFAQHNDSGVIKTAITNAADQIRQQQQRGFPDEALKDLLVDANVGAPEALFWKIKCLIEGRPATKEEADNA